MALLRRVLINKCHLKRSIAAWGFSPNRETISLVLDEPNAEVALILKSGGAFLMSGITKEHVVWATLERPIVLYCYISERLPTHEFLRKLERAVLHQLAIQAAIGSIVDVFKKKAVHRWLHLGTHFFGIDVERVGLCQQANHWQGGHDAR